jgi:hypothetical protein
MTALAVPVAAAGGACFALGLYADIKTLAGIGSVLLLLACMMVLL